MRLDVALTPDAFRPEAFRDSVVVVVDVLRASTTIVTALANGAARVIPCEETEEARRTAGSLPSEEVLLCGERGSRRIPGFDLGNSPAEYTRDRVEGRTLVFTTTNGTRLLRRSAGCRQVCVGGFVNARAVVGMLSSREEDCAIACAGQEGRFSMEDAVCAGMIAEAWSLGADGALGDAARAAVLLHRYYAEDLRKMAEASSHGRTLLGLGLDRDLELCTRTDVYDLVPVLGESGLIVDKG